MCSNVLNECECSNQPLLRIQDCEVSMSYSITLPRFSPIRPFSITICRTGVAWLESDDEHIHYSKAWMCEVPSGLVCHCLCLVYTSRMAFHSQALHQLLPCLYYQSFFGPESPILMWLLNCIMYPSSYRLVTSTREIEGRR